MLIAGTTVPGGYYFDRDGFDLVAIGGREGILPGDEGQRYLRIPTWAALLIAPVAGAAGVVLIPLFAIVRWVPRVVRAGWSGATTTGRASSTLLGLGHRAIVAIVSRFRRPPPSPPVDP